MKLAHLALLVPLLGLAELAGHLYFSRRAPRPEEWGAARAAVEAARQPGDVVVVSPLWAEPLARWQLGPTLFSLREVARPDVTRYPRAIELSALGAEDPELAGWPVRRETKVGRIVVRSRDNPAPPHVTYDFVDRLRPASAAVTVAKGEARTPCAWVEGLPVETQGLFGAAAWPSARFRCDGEGPYVFAGVTIIDDERDRPRRCIWSHPPAGGGELVTRFASVPLGKVLRGHTGVGHLIERDRAGAPITLRVLVAGEEVGRAVHADGDGWKPFELALAGHAGTTADVEFRASAPDAHSRHLCFEADSR